MKEMLFLVKNGVPFDVAFALDDAERKAFLVVMGELETGQEYDWDSDTWKERK